MAKPDSGRDILAALIADLTAVKRLPPRDRIQALKPLLDRASADNVETRLATARSLAARDATAAVGGNMSELARQIGVTPQRISSLIDGPVARRASANRRAASRSGAAGQ